MIMSNPNNLGNGCSLEDCHTNLFALADLAGIKWRKLKCENVPSADPLEDPVLQTFAKCIQADILCVWQRVKRASGNIDQNMQHMPSTGDHYNAKELWLFWYGDREPPGMGQLIDPNLHEAASGSWEHGLDYECRTLLFKALHNLIERCLLSRNFVRVGKWFVQPFDHLPRASAYDKSTHLSFSFSFFLHGESTVCASIDVREHPPLWRLHPYHLNAVMQCQQQALPVVLAPYGLAGTLTGVTYKESEPRTQKVLEEWKQFFVVPDPETWESPGDASNLPKLVEVVVAGVRMRYPTTYVLVHGDTEAEIIQQNGGTLPLCTPGVSPGQSSVHTQTHPLAAEALLKRATTGYPDQELDPSLAGPGSNKASTRALTKVLQDGSVTSGEHNSSCQSNQAAANQNAAGGGSGCQAENQSGTWGLGEPFQKNTCACVRCKPGRGRTGRNSPVPGGSSGHRHKAEKSEKERSRRHVPFHRRTTHTEALISREVDVVMMRLPARTVGSSCKAPPSSQANNASSNQANDPNNPNAAGTAANSNGTSNNSTVTTLEITKPRAPQPFHGNNAANDSLATDSPTASNSAQPSPLVAHATQPSPNNDATMPTLSPQSVPPKGEKADPNLVKSEAAVIGTVVGIDGSFIPKPGGVGMALIGPDGVKIEPGKQSPDSVMYKTESINLWLDGQKRQQIGTSLKRPCLSEQNYESLEDSEEQSSALYDFNSLNQWLDLPLKRPRSDMDDLSAPSHEGPLGAVGFEPGSSGADPYEFSDEASSGNVSYAAAGGGGGSGGKRAYRGSKEDLRAMQNGVLEDDSSISFQGEAQSGGGGGMLHEKDLKPTYELPEKMFDTSDDDSNSDTGANLMGGGEDDSIRSTTLLNGDASGKTTLVPGGLASDPDHSGLSHMYPTPPTHEHQINLSPPGGSGSSLETAGYTDLLEVIKSEPQVVTVSDYSYVYKPAITATFVSSTKYGPIELPSNTEEKGITAKAITDHCYTPSWQQFPQPLANKAQAPGHFTDHVGVGTAGVGPHSQPPPPHASRGHSNDRMTSHHAPVSPALAGGGVGGPRSAQQLTPRTPQSHELQSPLSNASSYMHNLKSVENATNCTYPEVSSVVVNVMLSDSLINLFRDENFASCNLCVCNKNVRGADMGLYLEDPNPKDLQFACTCGFSAVVNRRQARHAGLFYEDEVEITYIRHDELDVRKPSLASLLDVTKSNKPDNKHDPHNASQARNSEVVPQDLLQLLQGQFTSVYPSLTVARYGSGESQSRSNSQRGGGVGGLGPTTLCGPVNRISRMDACDACYTALEVGRQAMENCMSSKQLDDPNLKKTCMHTWPYLNYAKLPSNSQVPLRMLRRLLPLLEDAIQKKRTTRVWESVYRITGPLSWKDFHLLAGRGSDETSEPQPIPTVLVGYDKEWMSLTPQALQYWDKLMLEPYGRQRDVAYIVISPDTEFILERVKSFFSELSQQYELCRLGRHRPIAKKLREGIMRVNSRAAQNLADTVVDEWFNQLGNHPLAGKMRLYAQILKHQLAPFLTQPGVLERKEIFEELNHKRSNSNLQSSSQQQQTNNSMNQPRPSPGPPAASPAPPHTPGNTSSQGGNHDDNDDAHHDDKANRSATTNSADEADNERPSIVIYVVDPFTYGSEWDEVPRFAMLGLLRCFQEMLRGLPEPLAEHVHLQMVPVHDIVQYHDTADTHALRTFALSVYTQCRRLVQHSVIGRTLTGFGPAASAKDKTLKSEPGKTSLSRLYSPPFILAPTRQDILALSSPRDTCTGRVLLCGYCLSDDQRWLLGVVTDNRGEVLETCTINIDIPDRNRRKKASARLIGLRKLWDFLLGVMSASVHQWRLVIGRFGRLGHGELKGWAGILTRNHLLHASKQLKDLCPHMCQLLAPEEMPCIQSACLVSMEMHNSIVVMHDTLKMEERQSSRCQLTTPRDASVTHILVMPNSAYASSGASQTGGEQQLHLDDDDNLDDFIGGDINIGELGELGDLFLDDFMPGNDHGGGDQKQPGSLPSPPGGMPQNHPGGSTGDGAQDEQAKLMNQPQAIGYYVSTADTGPLPAWFYSNCLHKRTACPSCFKAALHVNTPNVQQDIGIRSPSKHPLDTECTPDVLRYVLETYNSLSWLTMDARTNERRSCLPVHFVVLMQLYHAINSFV